MLIPRESRVVLALLDLLLSIFEHIIHLVLVIGQRQQDHLFRAEAWDLLVLLGQLSDDVRREALDGLVALRRVWVWHLDLHLPLLKENTIAEHFNS